MNQENNQNYQGNNYNNQNQQYQQPVIEPEMPAEEVKVPKKKGKAVIITIVSILVAALLGVGGFFGYKYFKNKKQADETPTLAELEPSLISTIELYPDRNVSKADLETFAKTIEERAKVLGENFEVAFDDKKITLRIEKALLGNTATERAQVVELLTSRGTFSFGNDGIKSYYSPTRENISNITVTEFDRKDILADYGVGMSENRYKQIDSISEDKIYGLTIELDSQGEDGIDEILDTAFSEPKLTVIHDIDEEVSYEEYKFLANAFAAESGSNSKIYLVGPAAGYEKNADLMMKVLEQDELGFSLIMQIIDEPAWEVEGNNMGKNQVDAIDGNTVVIEVSPTAFTRSYNSEVDFAEYEKVVKNRLDTLDVKYMFGKTGFDDKTYCVKMDPGEIAPDFVRLMFANRDVTFKSAFGYVSGLTFDEVTEKDGKKVIRTRSSKTAEEILAENNIPSNMVYLVVNDVTIASADIMSLQAEGDYNYLYFENFLCFGNIAVSNEEDKIFELISVIEDEGYVPFEGTFAFRNYENDTATTLSIDEIKWKYPYLSAEDERVKGIIEGLGGEFEKLVDERNMINIYIDLPINGDLAQTFTDKVKEIYSLCGFDSGAYNDIMFILKDDSIDSPADKCRIEAYKSTSDQKMVLLRDISGPKFFDYWSPIYTIMTSDTFFVERSW